MPLLRPVIPAAAINGQGTAIGSRWGLCQAHGYLYLEPGN